MKNWPSPHFRTHWRPISKVPPYIWIYLGAFHRFFGWKVQEEAYILASWPILSLAGSFFGLVGSVSRSWPRRISIWGNWDRFPSTCRKGYCNRGTLHPWWCFWIVGFVPYILGRFRLLFVRCPSFVWEKWWWVCSFFIWSRLGKVRCSRAGCWVIWGCYSTSFWGLLSGGAWVCLFAHLGRWCSLWGTISYWRFFRVWSCLIFAFGKEVGSNSSWLFLSPLYLSTSSFWMKCSFHLDECFRANLIVWWLWLVLLGRMTACWVIPYFWLKIRGWRTWVRVFFLGWCLLSFGRLPVR